MIFIVSVFEFLKKHSKSVFRGVGAVLLCALMALFIAAFNSDKLPHSAEGDAFDTIFAVAESSESSAQ